MVRAAVGATFTVDGIQYYILSEGSPVKYNISTGNDDNKATIEYPAWSVRIIGINSSCTRIDGNGFITLPTSVNNRYYDFTVRSAGRNNTDNQRWSHNIKKIIIPEGFYDLCELNAFCGCKNLEQIDFPKSMAIIPENSLSQLENLTTITVASGNQYYTVEGGILFENKQEGINEFSVNNDNELVLKSNGKAAIKRIIRCPTKMTFTEGKYTIPEGVKISRYAFNYVDNLLHLELGKDMNVLFDDFAKLQYYTVNSENTKFSSVNGMLTNKEGNKMVSFPREYTPKEDGDLVYYTIENNASSGNREKGKLKVPDAIKTIGENCFRSVYAPYLTDIDFNNVVNIEKTGFTNLFGITSLNITEKLINIAEDGIITINNLTSFTVDANNPVYMAYENGILCVKGTVTNDDGTESIVPTWIKSVPILYEYTETPKIEGTKSGKQYTYGTFTIPNTVTGFDNRAFYGTHLHKLIVTEKVKKIGLLSDNEYLKEVDFSRANALNSFDNYAFSRTGLTTVTLPPSLTNTGAYPFQNCNDLIQINIPDNSQLKTIGSGLISGCPHDVNINFQGSCTLETIGENAFFNSKITKIDIPANVTTIGKNAFYNVSTLKTVTFKNTDPSITLNISTLAFSGTGIESINLPASLKTVGNEAFHNCQSLKTVEFSRSTTTIDNKAFMQCTQLTDFIVDEDNTEYSSVEGYLLSEDKTELKLFPPGKANSTFTLLPPSLTKIGDYAFYYCEELENVTIPNKVTSIGARAFGGCKKLNTITFLCESIIPAASFKMNEANNSVFDIGTNGLYAEGKIDIHVRKELYDDYKKEGSWYKTFFKSITPSYVDGTNGNEYIAVSNDAVDLLHIGADARTYTTYTIPAETSDGKTVSLIGDYAFQTNAGETTGNIQEVIIKHPVEYIGAKAFMTNTSANTSTVQNVFLTSSEAAGRLSTVRFKLNGSETANYDEFTSLQKIYVKKSQCDRYKENWEKFEGKIDYKIPDLSVSSKYGTFSREFDTYIGVDGGDNKTTVRAYYGGEIKDGNGDWGDETERHIRFTSINEGDAATIPANTGVLLKVQGVSATDADFYYSIAEEQTSTTYTPSVGDMQAIVGKPISEKESDGGVYGMSKATGQFMNVPSKQKFSMPIHRSYLQLEPQTTSQAKALVLHFEEDGIITTINAAETDLDFAPKAYYDLNGRRVDNPTKGVYVVNGKKVVF